MELEVERLVSAVFKNFDVFAVCIQKVSEKFLHPGFETGEELSCALALNGWLTDYWKNEENTNGTGSGEEGREGERNFRFDSEAVCLSQPGR